MNINFFLLFLNKLFKSRWFALLLIVSVAAGLRFYRLDRLPPGLDYDEGFNNLQALRMVRDKNIPVFIAEEYGALPMHHWLIAALFCLTGPIILGGRLVSALVGVLTVGLLYFAVWEMFYQEMGEHRAAVLGLMAALSLALLYWHVHYSRIGMEPTMVPLWSALALGWLWRALRRRRMIDAVLAGALLGGCVYTYPAAYFVPLLVGFFCGLWMLTSRSFARQQWLILVIVVVVALAVAAPLISFALTHPDIFFLRSRQVVNSTATELGKALFRLVGAFFVQGDRDPRLNLPGRPVLDLVQGLFFLLGLWKCITRRHPAHFFTWAWLVAMCLPSILTDRAPHFGRALGATPPIAVLIALGSLDLYDWLFKLVESTREMRRIVARTVLSLAFVSSGIHTAYDYFVKWGHLDTWLAFDGDLRWAGEYIATLPPDQAVYMSPPFQDHPTLRFLLQDRPDRVHGYDGRGCFVYSEGNQQKIHYLLWTSPDRDTRSLSWLQATFPEGRTIAVDRQLSNMVIYQIPGGSVAHLVPQHPLNVRFGDRILLRGYDLPDSSWRTGEVIRVHLYWQVTAPVQKPYKVFVHLWSAQENKIWGQMDAQPGEGRCPFPSWRPEDMVVDEYRIPIRANVSPGEYQLLVGLYLQEGPRLPIANLNGEPTQDHWVLTTVQVH